MITNQLSVSQLDDVRRLETRCKEYDNLKGSLFLSGELNCDPELPCFYLLYNPERKTELIAFLSVFAPKPGEAEIYACTAPGFRCKGCFNTLLAQALHIISDYGIRSLLFVHEPSSSACPAVLKSLNAEYAYSEYFMELSSPFQEDAPLPEGYALLCAGEADLLCLSRLHAAAFEAAPEASFHFLSAALSETASYARMLMIKGNPDPVGCCFFTVGPKTLVIFGVAVHPAHRRKGCARAMLTALLSDFSKNWPDFSVTLEVNSQNPAALSLYRELGFHITAQFDYSFADSTELLELFEEL